MKKIKNTLLIFIIIIALLLSIILGYRFLYHSYTESHKQKSEIIFHKLHHQTNILFNNLHYNYMKIKPTIISKHKIAENYLNKYSLDKNLTEIHNILNDGIKNKPYDIYITNNKLIITNTSFPPDLGFDLSFAKNIFEKHKKENILEACSPLFEKSSQGFMSYSDSYLKPKERRILQVSYRYNESEELFNTLQKSFKNYPSILEVKAYIFLNDGFINDMILHKYKKYKPNLNEIETRIREGKIVAKELGENQLYIKKYKKGNSPYRMMYLKTKSPILKDTYTIYRFTFDETLYHEKLYYLNLIFLLLLFIGLLAIVVIFSLWNREKSLNNQDQFIKSAMHEIQTPLSIITINNELRDLEYGKNEYGNEINDALKMLQNSYDDINFILMNQKINYPVESFMLNQIIQERIAYFSSIANSNKRYISFLNPENKSCFIKISRIELIRLIDNNLSNAIKYSNIGTVITVKLNNNILTFHSIGDIIKDNKAIFKKYVRENYTIGGYGLGLSIVKEITKRYKIETFLDSSPKFGTIFTYKFKCHSNVIS